MLGLRRSVVQAGMGSCNESAQVQQAVARGGGSSFCGRLLWSLSIRYIDFATLWEGMYVYFWSMLGPFTISLHHLWKPLRRRWISSTQYAHSHRVQQGMVWQTCSESLQVDAETLHYLRGQIWGGPTTRSHGMGWWEWSGCSISRCFLGSSSYILIDWILFVGLVLRWKHRACKTSKTPLQFLYYLSDS